MHCILNSVKKNLLRKKLNQKIDEEIQNGKLVPIIKWQNQKLKHIKQMGNNCHISDLVQAFLM